MNYERINWENAPSTDTPLDADNLNKMDEALDTLNREVAKTRSDVQEVEETAASLGSQIAGIIRLEDGSTTGDAELINGRVGKDGTTYPIIGDAIRGQIGDLRDHVIEVSDEEPEEFYNKIWVKDDEPEIEIPTKEELDDVAEQIGDLTELETTEKSNLVGAINEVLGDIPAVDDDLETTGAAADAKSTGDAIGELNERLTAEEAYDINGYDVIDVSINGSFGKNGPTTGVNNRIRTDLLELKAGDKITIANGTLEHACGIWKTSVSTENNVRNDNAFLTFTETIEMPYDGYAVVVFKTNDNSAITPSDYDGEIKVYRRLVNETLELSNDVYKYVDINVVGKNLYNKADTANTKDGVYVDYSNGRITNNASFTSQAIPVDAGEVISTQGLSGAHVTFYNMPIIDFGDYPSAYVLGGYISGFTGNKTNYEVPANAVCMIISISIANKNTAQVEYGETATEYEAYSLKPAVLTQQVLRDSGLAKSQMTMTEYTIKADGSGDFTDLKACFESITDSSEKHQYIVNVYPGTYNIASLYQTYDTRGLTIPDYVTLRGIGDKHNIILDAELVSLNSTFSTLNFLNVCSVENMTIKSKNCRYTIHDDFQGSATSKNIRNIKDVIFIGENCYYGSVYGSGLKGNADWNFENCEFDASKSAQNGTPGNAFSLHNNVNSAMPSFVKFRNCRLLNGSETYKTFRLLSMPAGSANGTVTVTMEGNKVDGIRLSENDASQYGAGCSFWVNGFGNVNTLGVSVVSSDGIDYTDHVDLI